jgi:hypothetical protein
MNNNMKNKILLILILHLSAGSISFTQNEEFEFVLSMGDSINILPTQIPIIENKIYLYADFNNINNESIPIYLVNNTNNEFRYTGSEVPLLQQEFKDSDGIWKRSQSFYYGWCGTPYLFDYKIEPKKFEVFYKPFPSSGNKKEVRYVFYEKEILKSNIVFGNVSSEEIEKAKFDDIALSISGEDFLIKIIKGEIVAFEEERKNDFLIGMAMMQLRNQYPNTATVILSEIANDPANKFYEQAVRDLKVIRERNLFK